MSNPLVSVVIAAFNGEKFIQQSLKSCLTQTYPHLEILVVNDKSTDNTAEIVKEYQKKDSRVRLISHSKNKGVAGARNTGIANSQGEYIQLFDQDDLMFPYKIEYSLKFMQKYPSVGISYGDYIIWAVNAGRNIYTKMLSPPPKPQIYRTLFLGCFIPLGTTLIKKEVFETIGILDEDLSGVDDFDFWCRAVQFFPIGKLEAPLYIYRVHDQNQIFNAQKQRHRVDYACLKHLWSLPPEELFSDYLHYKEPFRNEIIANEYLTLSKDSLKRPDTPYDTALEMLKIANKISHSHDKQSQIRDLSRKIPKMLKERFGESAQRLNEADKKTIRKKVSLYPKPQKVDLDQYNWWIYLNEPHSEQLNQNEKIIPVINTNHESNKVKISIAVPIFETPQNFLIEMLESVLSQTYPNWELCLVNGGSRSPHVKEILEEYSQKDARIKALHLSQNLGIAGNTNKAISMAEGEFVALMDHDDTLASFALSEVVKTIEENPNADLIYSDEDVLSEDGKKRYDPHFKPNWSPDLLRSHNYINHLTVIRKKLLEEIGGFREDFEFSQDHDLFLRISEKTAQIVHIPKALYHWRAHEGSAAGNSLNKMAVAIQSSIKALKQHLERRGIQGEVEPGFYLCVYKTSYAIPGNPKVSILIPNKDNVGLLEKCIHSILNKTTWSNYEIIIIENNSEKEETFAFYETLKTNDKIRILQWNNPFNWSAINNFGARYANGEVFLFLNNDTEVITPDWIQEMLMHALRKEIGCVGAKLYDQDKNIQHAGIVVGMGWIPNSTGGIGTAANQLENQKDEYRDANWIKNVMAVTGACLMVRKDIFEKLRGFDESSKINYTDVDFCIRAFKKGYLNLYTPYSQLFHYGRQTRGSQDIPSENETRWFLGKYKDLIEKGDPYWNPNLSTAYSSPVLNIGLPFIQERRVPEEIK